MDRSTSAKHFDVANYVINSTDSDKKGHIISSKQVIMSEIRTWCHPL